jgi:hypothetical protein
MEVEDCRLYKEGIENQIMGAYGFCTNTIEYDVVVPKQLGDRCDTSVNYRSVRSAINDVIQNIYIIRLRNGDFSTPVWAVKGDSSFAEILFI